MTDVKPGDRVRVTYEGVAEQVNGFGQLQVRTPFLAWAPPTAKVEVLEPADDPSRDPIGTVRVNPNDDPNNISADRLIKLAAYDAYVPSAGQWYAMTQPSLPTFQDAGVVGWPKQSLAEVARIFGHPHVEPELTTPRLRVFQDQHDDRWYELFPDKFTFGLNRGDAAEARSVHAHYVDWTFAKLSEESETLTEVTE